MSSAVVMVLVILSLFIPAVRPSQDLWTLKCLPTVGIVAETTVINCNFKDMQEFEIEAVFLTKAEENKLSFLDNKYKSRDPRFSLKNPTLDPSLEISNTMFSDEGEYVYRVVTDRGDKTVQFRITITAKYKNPISSTWPKDVIDGELADLYCNATDGYPAGFIHWFDRSGTNWTINSELTKTTNDTNGFKSVALSSKLTFKSIQLNLGPFKCIVLNSKYMKDGESSLHIPFSPNAREGSTKDSSLTSNTTHIVAGVMVIGSLIVGLLFALLIFRKKKNQNYETADTDGDDDLERGNKS